MPVLIYPRPQAPMRPAARPAARPAVPPGVVSVAGMGGLGDCIYSRAFIKALARTRTVVYVTTPWPQLLADIDNVRFVHSPTGLRTQAKNVARQPATLWATPPRGLRPIAVSYGHAALRSGSIVAAMRQCFGVDPDPWDLPAFAPPVIATTKPIAVVRPATLRTEWSNPARNPRAEYVAYAAHDLMRDYHVVSVADLVAGVEWLDGDEPPAHTQFHAGELSATQLLGLIQSARIVVGGVGFVVPACIAASTPLFCVLGGHGGHNHPEKITDPRMDLRHVGFATPDRYCPCENPGHGCNKTITDFGAQWQRYRDTQGL